jgi:hypothetical protein
MLIHIHAHRPPKQILAVIRRLRRETRNVVLPNALRQRRRPMRKALGKPLIPLLLAVHGAAETQVSPIVEIDFGLDEDAVCHLESRMRDGVGNVTSVLEGGVEFVLGFWLGGEGHLASGDEVAGACDDDDDVDRITRGDCDVLWRMRMTLVKLLEGKDIAVLRGCGESVRQLAASA